MEDDPARALSSLRKKRGTTRGSITKLSKNLKDLEAHPDGPDVVDRARQYLTRLEILDKEFKSLHFQVIDLIGDEEVAELGKEQDVLDTHDDNVTAISLHLQQLVTKASASADNAGVRKAASRKLL